MEVAGAAEPAADHAPARSPAGDYRAQGRDDENRRAGRRVGNACLGDGEGVLAAGQRTEYQARGRECRRGADRSDGRGIGEGKIGRGEFRRGARSCALVRSRLGNGGPRALAISRRWPPRLADQCFQLLGDFSSRGAAASCCAGGFRFSVHGCGLRFRIEAGFGLGLGFVARPRGFDLGSRFWLRLGFARGCGLWLGFGFGFRFWFMRWWCALVLVRTSLRAWLPALTRAWLQVLFRF